MDQIKVELQETMGSDRSIANSAWTSSTVYSKKKVKTDEEVKKLIEYLALHKHSTPFESVIFRFWIKMPIATDRQFMSHRIQSSSGLSGRYRTMPNEFLEVPEDVLEICRELSGDYGSGFYALGQYEYLCEQANEEYNKIIVNLKENRDLNFITNDQYKRCREFFRGMLPQHNMTERVSIMNLRSFANFMKLRNSPHAQPEIRKVAELMLEEVKKANICSISIENLEKNAWQI